jgi:hypothetical protein
VKTKCGVCGKPLGSFETIHVAEKGPRCYPCFNREMAEHIGVNFDNVQFQPIVVADADGVSHTFDIQSMIVGTGHEVIAREIQELMNLDIASPSSATSKRTPGSCSSISTPACGRRRRNVTCTEPNSVGN